MNAWTIGSSVATLGLVGFVAALTSRRMLRDHALARTSLREWEGRLQEREAALDRRAREIHEWEGRLIQVAVYGCDPQTLDEPPEGRVRPDRTPPRGRRPGRPPTRRG